MNRTPQATLSPAWVVRAGAACVAFVLLAGSCAPHLVTFDQQLFFEADSLMKAGNYALAKQRFAKARDINPASSIAARAQFNIGYIDVYFDNPDANWEIALREFKAFMARYPNSELLPEVSTWTRLLVVLQAFKREYNLNTSELKAMQNRAQAATQAKQSATTPNFELLLESANRCYSDRDSLLKKIKTLEEVIEIFEKKR